jgi:protein involved in polysaccharide export with SLBB domain
LKNKFLLVITFFVWGATVHAQTREVIEQQARTLIQSKGLDETEVRERLSQRGIEIDQVTPEQLPQLQSTIEEVLRELEAEKAQKNGNAPSASSSGTPPKDSSVTPTVPQGPKSQSLTVEDAIDIKEKIKEGVSIEEALSESVTSDKQKQLPPAKIWGQHLFRDKSLTVFRTTNEVKPPDSYILSTGDVITISVFGVSQFDSQFEINKNGYIQPSGMPKMFLKGIELGKAKELLRNRFQSFYRFAPEQFAVSLTTARTITVNIFGETNNYGSFTVSAINTAFNALVAAGGPSDIGSVRNIKVIRGKQTRLLDVYAFMNNPSVQYDFFLEDNDIIYVPIAEKVVKLNGAVRRPFSYELTQSENLIKLLEYAGGLKANAYSEYAQVKRFENNKQVIIDISLKDALNNKDFILLNGDEITIKTITAPIEEVATIKGAVRQPGTYSLLETPTAGALLKKGVLNRTARTDIAFIQRKNPDGSTQLLQITPSVLMANGANDLSLQPLDTIVIYDRPAFTDQNTISVKGAVRAGLKDYPYSLDSSITIQKAILLAGGLKPEANGSGYVIRTNPENVREKTYIPVNIGLALEKPNGADNIVLLPLDEVEVFSTLEYSDEAEVTVLGAVRKTGKFKYSPALALKDVLILSGGLKMEAATNRVDVYRVEFINNEPTRTKAISLEIDQNFEVVNGGGVFKLRPFDEIVVRSVPDFEFQQFVEVNGEVMYPGRYALVYDNETLSSVIKRAGGLSPEGDADACTLFRTEKNKGLVITRLKEALEKPGSNEDHYLKPGDVITVPKMEGLVTIKGQNTDLKQIVKSNINSGNQINAAHYPGHRAGWYVREYAGGFSKDAQRRRVTVEMPNGKISRTKHFLFINVYPKVERGATVYVPVKPPKKEKTDGKKDVDWDKKLTQILAFMSMVTSSIIAYSALK